MLEKHSLTFYMILLHLLIIPIVPLKIDIGPLPLSAEVVLIPLLTLVFILELKEKRINMNNVNMKPFLILFSIFLVVQVISLSQAVALMPGIKEIIRYISYVILFYIVMKVKFAKKEYRVMAYTFLLSLTVIGVYGLLQYVFDFNLNKAGVYALAEAYGRVQSTMVNPNYWAGFINFVIPILLVLAVVYVKDKRKQIVLFSLFGIFVINQILTYTRSAWLIMALAIILTSLLIPKHFYKRLFTIHLIFASIILGVIVYNLPDVKERTTSAMFVIQSFIPFDVTGGEASDGDGELSDELKRNQSFTNKAVVSRTTLWKTGLVMYRENPGLGVGIGNYGERYKEYVTKYPELYVGHDRYSVHNSYLKVAAETGTVGLLSFMLIYLYYYFFMAKAFLHHKEDLLKKVLLIGLFVGSGTFFGQNLANNLIFIPQLNVLFWLISGLIFNFVHTSLKRA